MEISIVPALTDNYMYLLRDEERKLTAVVDPSEAEPIAKTLYTRGWNLTHILCTHHHPDHTGGNLELKKRYGAKIIGYEGDASRIPGIDEKVSAKTGVKWGENVGKVIEIPGHTLGHVAYWFEKDKALFCGDTLFSIGCGRLFEGTPENMWASLNLLKALPPETKVYCGHEYTMSNLAFARTLAPHDLGLARYQKEVKALRDKGKPSIPSTLATEIALNPFLKTENALAFKEIRHRKNQFKG